MVIVKEFKGLAETSTVPISFATTSTVGASVSGDITTSSTISTLISSIEDTTSTIPVILDSTSTIGVVFPTSSTVQAVSAPGTGSTVESHLVTTTATIPVIFDIGSTVQAVSAAGIGSTVESHLVDTSATIPVIIDATSTIGAAITGGVTLTGSGSTIQSLYAGVGYTNVHRQQNVNVVTGTIIWTSAADKKIVLTDMILSTSTANTITVTVDTSTIGPFYFTSWGGMVSNFQTSVESAGTAISLRLTTTAGTTSITCDGFEK